MKLRKKNRFTILETYKRSFLLSKKLYGQALSLFPNGVTHDNRFLRPFPIYIDRASGSKKWDVDGKEYIDYWVGHGALILGHGHPEVVRAVTKQMSRGTHYGACHKLEIAWGGSVVEMIASAEKVRFTSSGTEATLMALRLARIFTGKNKVVKFAGHFHGWHDNLTLGVDPPYELPSPGVLEGVVKSTIICPPNDIETLGKVLEEDKDIACVILEPTGASFGIIPTYGEFLKQLRKITKQHGVLLIFDEVVTGFRCAPGGAQEYYNVLPDLTTLGKILGGGLPGAAVAGREEILELIEIKDDISWKKNKKMFHPGTFNANPLSASAGVATLKIVATKKPIEQANKMASLLRKGINEVISKYRLNWCVHGDFSGFRYLLNHKCKKRGSCNFRMCDYGYREIKGTNPPLLVQNLRCGMLLNGIDIPPAGGMTSAAHSLSDVQRTIEAFDGTIQWMKNEGLI